MRPGIAILEIRSLAAALVMLDEIEKAAAVQLLQAELNDFYGYVLKLLGKPADLRIAVRAGQERAEQLRVACVATILDAPDSRAWRAIESPAEHQPLIEQDVVFFPATEGTASPAVASGANNMHDESSHAIGLIETQGFTAVFEAIDAACKAANVEVIGKEKLGGGYITVLIRGDVAAVKAAVEAGQAHVDELGTLIAAHVIARPSSAVLGLLPKSVS